LAKEKVEKTNEEIIEEKSSEEVENILENDSTSNENNIIEELQSNIRSLTDKNMRIQAEFANYKSRNEQEKTLMFKYEGEALIKQMLEVIDDFERAINMDDNDLSDEVSNFLKGFKMVYTRMIGILDNLGVKEIPVEGKEFDPNFSEAILTDHDENKPENVVLEVLKKGYIYKDKLIRPAMVKVNK